MSAEYKTRDAAEAARSQEYTCLIEMTASYQSDLGVLQCSAAGWTLQQLSVFHSTRANVWKIRRNVSLYTRDEAIDWVYLGLVDQVRNGTLFVSFSQLRSIATARVTELENRSKNV